MSQELTQELMLENYDDEIFTEVVSKKELESSEQLNITVDTEYQGLLPLTLQFKVKGMAYTKKFKKSPIESLTNDLDQNFIVVDEAFKYLFPACFRKYFRKKFNCQIYFRKLTLNQNENILSDILLYYLHHSHFKEYMIKNSIKISICLWFYYSVKDINIAFGPEFMRKQYLNKSPTIFQRRTLSGHLKIENNNYHASISSTYVLKDLSGLDKYGLAQMSQSYGISSSKSEFFDDYKSQMSKALRYFPGTFLEYGLQDVFVTQEITEAVIAAFNDLLKNTFQIKQPDLSYSYFNMPTTIGVLVADMFMKYLKVIIFENNLTIQACMFIQGNLNPASSKYNENLELFTKIKSFKSIKKLTKGLEKDSFFRIEVERMVNSRDSLRYAIFQFASTKFLTEISHNNLIFPLSMVSGGRVVNERPLEYFIDVAADLDIVSAYAEILRRMQFIIGRPNIYTKSLNEKKNITLGKFMEKYGHDLTNKNYKISVSGKLPFDQDIIFSRILSNDTIKNKHHQFDPDDSSTFQTSHPLVLLRQEILNGTITYPTWQILRKVCTNQELKEINGLVVDSALYWLDSDRVKSVRELAEIFLKDTGELIFDRKFQTVIDKRTKKWYGLDFEPIIGQIVDTRKALKIAGINFGLQNSLKLFVNTLYGVICSVFFPLNNVVLGDLITSSIRASCWLMAKAFNTFISVTDGGITCLRKFSFLKSKAPKPGLGTLSDFQSYSKHPSIEIAPLDGQNWDDRFKNIFQVPVTLKEIAELSLDHLKKFWKPYEIEINFTLETKNLIKTGAYFLKAHYYLYVFDYKKQKWGDIPFFRIRGFKYEKEEEFQNPMYDFLRYIAEKGSGLVNPLFYNRVPWIAKNEGEYKTRKILRIPSWKLSLIDKIHSEYGLGVLPGDTIYQSQIFRINNSHIFLRTLKNFKTIDNRSKKNYLNHDKTKTKPLLFEKFLYAHGIECLVEKMYYNKLR